MKTTLEDLRDDLLRRADACDLLARDHHDTGNHGGARRCEGKALAYRHAADLLDASPLAAEVARLTRECASLDAEATAARDEAVDARRARDAVEDALRGVWHVVAPASEDFPRVPAGDDEVADSATIVARVEGLTAERDAVRDRARKAAQTILAAIGADGPQNIEEAAERIVARLRHSEAAEAALRAAMGGAR